MATANGARAVAGDGAAGTRGSFAREASDLKRLLDRIADRIADVDRRHSATLGQMQERVAGLGQDAKEARSLLPQHMSPPLERIESTLERLSERLEAQDGEHRSGPALIEAPHHVDNAPLALRSALGHETSSSFTRKDGARSAEVDPFDVVGFTDAEAGGWDEASADALVRAYETDAGDAGSAAADQDGAAAEPVPQAGAAIVRLAGPGAHPGGDHDWLEQRFGEIATRLEQSMAQLRPDSQLRELGQRFTQLETRFGQALDDAVTRADLAGLKAIERQVTDLSERVIDVSSNFRRLDKIEQEVRALAERISEERLAELFKRAAPGDGRSGAVAAAVAKQLAEQMPRIETQLKTMSDRLSEERLAQLVDQGKQHQADPDRLATLVAERVASAMPQADRLRPEERERIDELRALVTSFISEQRQGGEQTTTMLDTMQQAMIRLLDRMDALESAVPQHIDAHGTADADFADHYASREPAAAFATEGRLIEQHGPAAAGSGGEPTNRPQEADYEAAAIRIGGPEPAQPQPQPAQQIEVEPPQAAAPRDDFIASARRAARQATAQKLEHVDELGPVGRQGAGEEPAQPVAAKPAKATAGKRSPSMLMIVLMVLIALGASFTVVNSFLKPGKVPGGVERRLLTPETEEREAGEDGARGRAQGGPVQPSEKGEGQQGERGGLVPRRSSLAAPQMMGELGAARVAPGGLAIEGAYSGHGPAPFGAASPGVISSTSLLGQQGEAVHGVRVHAGTPSTAIVTSALPTESATAAVSARVNPKAPAGAGGRAVNEMPPVTIGPLSLRNAAAKGDPSAEFEIGVRYAEAKGVTQDLKQAVAWYQRSAAQGFAPAQYRLATMHERGFGVPTDLNKARMWYERAAEQGNVKAMHNLAVLSSGRDVATDYAAAQRWFTAAAEHGLIDSQFNLAIIYDSGLGVSPDPVQAYKWYAIAARAGDEEAARRRDGMKGKLSATDLAAVEAEVADWRARSASAVLNDPRAAGEAWKTRAN